MNTDMIAFETEMKRLRGAYIFDIAPAIEMYRALLARVAELEATLAAQGWRPVTEKPVADDVAGCVPATATPVVWEAGRQ